MDRKITYAIEHLKKKKAEGSDGIPVELLKEICKQIYISGEWPDDFMKTTMIPLQKKSNACEC